MPCSLSQSAPEDVFPYHQLDSLDSECTVLAERAKHIVIQGIQKLPTEILCEIFRSAVPAQARNSPPIRVRAPRTQRGPWKLLSPWSLGQVCGRWRAVALSLPSLWTSISIYTHLSARELFLIQMQLERSRDAPLVILIRCMYECKEKLAFDTLVREYLVLSSLRWRRLEFIARTGHSDPAIFHFILLRPMPLLQELISDPWDHYYSYLANAGSPNLVRIVAGRYRLVPWGWDRLVAFRALCSGAAYTFLERLLAAANLVECDIRTWASRSKLLRIAEAPMLTLPHLRRLAVNKSVFLRYLDLPALQELHVEGQITDVLPCLHRSTCPLRRLSLVHCTATHTDVARLLRAAPSLTTLEIDFLWSHWSTADLRALIAVLTIPDGRCPGVQECASTCLCPLLTALSWGDRTAEMDCAAFVDMVHAHRRAAIDNERCEHSPLLSVGIYLGGAGMRAYGRWMQWMGVLA
ncbi:hypothetical protein GGX14DRAFT_485347 [Mycena pura]|uniref:F-box domain-containing protein n=1 Tax=Mycena pura TaxID=153505 RepID=A0AAD6UKQ4_9AGAR|nr:hypothetical protein GGX14DRAFT_485347 [Mycena pura]